MGTSYCIRWQFGGCRKLERWSDGNYRERRNLELWPAKENRSTTEGCFGILKKFIP